MGYQSEAELESKLIEKLVSMDYPFVEIPDYDSLVENFRVEINKFNDDVLKGVELSDTEFTRLLNYLSGKSVFQCAKQLRDQFVLERDDGTTVYLRFISPYDNENIYQVTNQVRIVATVVWLRERYNTNENFIFTS